MKTIASRVETKKLLRMLLLVIGSIALAVLVLMAVFNQLIADDVAYFAFIDDSGFVGFLDWHYFGHTGRLLQSWLVAGGYGLFGDLSVKVMPLVALAAFCGSIYLLLTRAKLWKVSGKSLNIGVAITIGAVALLLMPSTYDSYLWWTSSSIYLMSIAFLVFDFYVADKLVRDKLTNAKQAVLLVLVALGQTLSEITSAILIGMMALVLVYFIYKRHAHAVKQLAKVCAALVVGLVVTYFSPGSADRRAREEGASMGFDLINMFVLSIRHFFELLATFSVWEFGLLIVLGAIFGGLARALSKAEVIRALLGVAVALFVGVYGSFVANNYIWLDMSWRTFTLPSFLWTVSLLVIFALIFNRLYQYPRLAKVLPVLTVLLLLPVLAGMVARGNANVSFMAVRDAAYRERVESIRQNLRLAEAAGQKTVDVHALPILLISNATDLIYGVDQQVDWYEDALKRRNNIPSETRINVLNSPADYCYTGNCDKEPSFTNAKRVINKMKYWVDF